MTRRTTIQMTHTRAGDMLRDFAATLAFIALLAAIFIGAFGAA